MKKGGLATVIQLFSVSLFYLIFCNLRKILDAQEGIEPSSSGYEPDMLPLQTPRKIEASNRI